MEGAGFWKNMLRGENGLPLEDIGDLPDFQESPVDERHSPTDDEQHSPVVEITPSIRPNQKRKKNFNVKEDELLVSGWLNVSTNSVVGTNQTNGTFWKRVYAYYHNSREFESERSLSSLMHRWSDILKSVNKFCGCITQIELRRQSGVTIQDKLTQAMAVYKSQDDKNKSFALMHCWNILRDQPKWHEKMKELAFEKQVANKKQKATKDATPGTSTPINGSNNGQSENESPDTDVRKRPTGKKAAKKALQRGGGEDSDMSLQQLWEKKKEYDAEKEQKKEVRYNQSYELERERLEMERRRVQAEEARVANETKSLMIKENELNYKMKLDEERIMTMDIDSLPQLQQQYYKSLQRDILARRVAN